MTDSSLQNLKEKIALACRIAYFEGLCEQLGNEYAGHISVKIGEDRILMPGHTHQFGRGLRDMAADDMIVVDMKGKRVEGNLEPVDEVVIHTSVYKARPDVGAVVHVHPPVATALASTDGSLSYLSLRSCFFADGIGVLERGPMLIDNTEVAEDLVKNLGKRSVVIHRGHGLVTVGKSLPEACIRAVYLEGALRFQLLAQQLGHLKPFDKEQVARFSASNDLSKSDEVWLYYENKWKHSKA